MKKSITSVLAGVALSMFLTLTASAGPMLQFRLAAATESPDSERMTYVTHNDGQSHTNVFYVQKEVLLDETMLKSAYVNVDALGHNNIKLQFNEAGLKRLAEVTRANLHKQLAMIIDGKIYGAPVIHSEISGGTAQISGLFTKAEANDLAQKLNEAAKHK